MTSRYTTKTSVKIPVKVRNGVIDRYFEKFNELPHMIVHVKEKPIPDKRDFLCLCESANNTAVISYREQFNEFIMYDL